MSSFSQRLEEFRSKRIALIRDDNTELCRAVLVSPCLNLEAAEVNRMLSLSSGHLYAAISSTRATELMIASMRDEDSLLRVPRSEAMSQMRASVEAREGVSTGISAADRARTLSILGDPNSAARDLVQPGHIFPVVVRDGGLLVKNALPEASFDLCSAAELGGAAVYIDCLDSHGEFLKESGQQQLSSENSIPEFRISEILEQRLTSESLVKRVAEAELPTELAGTMKSVAYKAELYDGEHIALIKGEIDPESPTLVRVQPESGVEDLLGAKSSSRQRLESSLRIIGERGNGVLVYLRKPSSEIAKQRQSPSRMREYGVGAQILRDLGVGKIHLLTSSKKNLIGLDPFGIEIVSQEELPL